MEGDEEGEVSNSVPGPPPVISVRASETSLWAISLRRRLRRHLKHAQTLNLVEHM